MKNSAKKILASMFLVATLLTSCEAPSLIQETVLSTTPDGKISNAKAVAYTLPRWMGALDGTKKLSEFSIPGSHDSGALFEPLFETAKCQSLSIDKQLNAGVRYLDIRCRHYKNAFAIHHGLIYQHLNFNDVLKSCTDFLNKNPTETIIMSVQEEHTSEGNNRSFEATFNAYVRKNRTLWYLKDVIPTLDSAKGKIVLARAFDAKQLPKGIDRRDKKIVKSQNQYKITNNSDKWKAIKEFADEAKNGNRNMLYLNYSSGFQKTFILPRIRLVSDYINPRINNFFTTNTSGRFGVIVMDFVQSERNELIIKTNF